MKKMINVAFYYGFAALAAGVFYREFTKYNQFTGLTVLSKIHSHLFVLGMIMFLLIALFASQSRLTEERRFKQFFVLYNIGLPFTVIMMIVRGIFQILGTNLPLALSASISGLAGIAHALIGIGIILLFLALRKIAKN